MANYNLVVGSQYDPFTYQELLAPLARATEAHQRTEEMYAVLADKAASLETLKDSDIDKDSYSEYQKYAETLEKARDSLYSKGLSGRERQMLMKLRKNFAGTIEPLQKAYEKREKEAQMQLQAEMSNPYIRFSRDAINTPLSQYMQGTPDIKAVDGSKLAQLASSMALPYAKTVLNDMSKGDLEKILPFQYQKKVQKGLSTKEFIAGLAEAASNNPQSIAAQIISNIQNQVFNSSGINEWEESRKNEITPWAYSMINSGLNSLVGETITNNIKDDWGMRRAEQDLDLKNMLLKAQTSQKGPVQSNFAQEYLYSPIGPEDFAENREKFKKFFSQDSKGNYYMSKEGMTQLMREFDSENYFKNNPNTVISTSGYPLHFSNTKGRQTLNFIREIAKNDKEAAAKLKDASNINDPYYIGKLYANWLRSNGINDIGSNADLQGQLIYSRRFNDSSSKAIIKAIRRNLGHASSVSGQRLNKEGQYENIEGNNLKVSDINEDNFNLQDIYINPTTGNIRARLESATGGEDFYDIDAGTATILQSYPDIKNYMDNIKIATDELEKFKKGRDLNNMSDRELKVYQYIYGNLIENQNELYRRMASIFAETEIADEKVDINK